MLQDTDTNDINNKKDIRSSEDNEGKSASSSNNKELYTGQFERMTDHIYRFTFPFVFAKLMPYYSVPTSCFLVFDSEKSRYTLIDVGPENAQAQVVNALCKFFDRDYEISKKKIDKEQAAKALKEIDHVCLTHFHNDHSGNLRSLSELSQNELKVFIHEKEVGYVQDGKKFKEQVSESSLFSFTKYLFKNTKLEVPCRPFEGVMNEHKPNEQIISETNNHESKKHCLCYCHCPGHTEGHSCFYHEEDRALICGDILMNIKNKNTVQLEGSLAFSSVNSTKSIENGKKLIGSLSDKVDLILPSHDYSTTGHSIDVVKTFYNKS